MTPPSCVGSADSWSLPCCGARWDRRGLGSRQGGPGPQWPQNFLWAGPGLPPKLLPSCPLSCHQAEPFHRWGDWLQRSWGFGTVTQLILISACVWAKLGRFSNPVPGSALSGFSLTSTDPLLGAEWGPLDSQPLLIGVPWTRLPQRASGPAASFQEEASLPSHPDGTSGHPGWQPRESDLTLPRGPQECAEGPQHRMSPQLEPHSSWGCLTDWGQVEGQRGRTAGGCTQPSLAAPGQGARAGRPLAA